MRRLRNIITNKSGLNLKPFKFKPLFLRREISLQLLSESLLAHLFSESASCIRSIDIQMVDIPGIPGAPKESRMMVTIREPILPPDSSTPKTFARNSVEMVRIKGLILFTLILAEIYFIQYIIKASYRRLL